MAVMDDKYDLTDADCEKLLKAIFAPKGTRFGQRVPKCKECEYYYKQPCGKINYHHCHIPNDKDYDCRTMSASEVKTSPKWCPKREDS